MMENIYYRIISFDLTRFEPSYDKFKENEPVAIESEFDFAFNTESNIIRCSMNLHFLQEKNTVLKTQLLTFLEIKKESVETLTKDNKIVLPKETLTQFASFGYGAMRGIMYLKTINTPFQGIILPPTELHKVFSNTVEIPLNQ